MPVCETWPLRKGATDHPPRFSDAELKGVWMHSIDRLKADMLASSHTSDPQWTSDYNHARESVE
jgi:hypothetical protein